MQGGTLELELDTQPSEVLHFWATDDTKRYNGVVNVFEADSEIVRDKLAFFDAHCVRFSKHLQPSSTVGSMTTQLTLSANKLQFGETEIHNHWPALAAAQAIRAEDAAALNNAWTPTDRATRS